MAKEYIEREVAIESFRKNLDGGYVLTNDAQTTHILQSIPAADVRPVVLCRDCKCYRQSSFVDKHMECARSRFLVHPVDFCSFGERREES